MPVSAPVVVIAEGQGSLSRYGEFLAECLPVRSLRVNMTGTGMDLFGTPLLRWLSAAAVPADRRLVGQLRQAGGLLHFTHHHMARYGPATGLPYVLTMHDLIRWFDLTHGTGYISRPTVRDRIGLRRDYAAVGKAAAIIAVSEATKRDLMTHLGVPAELITVVYEGVDHRRFRPVEHRPVDGPYVLFVGSEHPRKNLPLLLRAFAQTKRCCPELKLVKVGAAGNHPEGDFRGRTMRVIEELGIEPDVMFTGVIDDADLPGYYSGAVCTVLPSRAEGFGLPVVEAMACGSPVVVSSAGALPEIAGEAGLLVDPDSVDALATAIYMLASDEDLRAELRGRGLVRAAGFSWQRAADRTLAVYQRVGADLTATGPSATSARGSGNSGRTGP